MKKIKIFDYLRIQNDIYLNAIKKMNVTFPFVPPHKNDKKVSIIIV